MIKRVIIACMGAAVLLSAGMAVAGVPCAGTSECNVSVVLGAVPGYVTQCTSTEGVLCPSGDRDTILVEVVIRDCYGNVLEARDVTFNQDGDPFYFCEAVKTASTDALGEASVIYPQVGGCGFMQLSATSEGVTIQGNLIYVASFDCFNDPVDPGDDGKVDLADFARFASVYQGSDPCVDFNCDGVVDLTDFAEFASHYLDGCP